MKALAICLITILLAAPVVAARDGDSERVRQLEERVRELEERLSRIDPEADDIDAALDRYFADSDTLDESVTRVVKGNPGLLGTGMTFELSGQLWLFYNHPSSGLGLDGGRPRADMDYLYLFFSGESGPFGFRTWLGLRDTPRYTPDSPWGRWWINEAVIYAKIPTFDLGGGSAHVVTVEAGKVIVPFGIEWDHTWYGSVIYYKGSMLEPDWGLRALGNLPVADGFTLDYALAYLNRSDDLDGPSSLAGFGLEGTGYQSPEFTDDPDLDEREQRGQFVGRLALNGDLGGGVSGTLGGSYLTGRIRESAADGSDAYHYGKRTDSLSQQDWELDLVLTFADVDLGFIKIPEIQLTAESLWYDRGESDQKGRAYLVELFLRLYANEDSEWLQAIEVWYNYSADKADNQPDSYLHLPSIGLQLNERVRLMLEYVSWTTSDYAIDRGIYVHFSFDF
jgi:hypothetical protein